MRHNFNNLLTILWVLVLPLPAVAQNNWGLEDIEVGKAHKISRGTGVRVCVVDTGIEESHPALTGKLCLNHGSIEFGWDFVENKKNPVDSAGHGTHVAGIITATAPKSCVVPVKWFVPNLPDDEAIKNIGRAVKYCMLRGAKIINLSGGGTTFADEEREIIENALRHGALFVAAAGNEYADLDYSRNKYFPASYRLAGAFIVVAATNRDANVIDASNFGVKTVHLAAPGSNIKSAVLNGQYGNMTGTSMATPFVSGVAALIWAKYPSLTAVEVKNAILSSVDQMHGLDEKVSTGGKLNAYRALLKAKEIDSQKMKKGIK